MESKVDLPALGSPINPTSAMSLSVSSMKSQMGRANKSNARFALIVGEEEIKNNTVALKDMDLGTQEILPAANMVDAIKNKI